MEEPSTLVTGTKGAKESSASLVNKPAAEVRITNYSESEWERVGGELQWHLLVPATSGHESPESQGLSIDCFAN